MVTLSFEVGTVAGDHDEGSLHTPEAVFETISPAARVEQLPVNGELIPPSLTASILKIYVLEGNPLIAALVIPAFTFATCS